MSSLLNYKGKHVGVAASSVRGPRYAASRRDSAEEINFDIKQNARSVVGEILRNISLKEGITKGRRLAYLNAFVKYLQKLKSEGTSSTPRNLGFNTEEICICLRICLVNEASVIRMAALRALRYLIVSEEDLVKLNATHIPYLVVRSMDVVLNNSGERMQATRLCQRILAIPNGAAHFPCAVTRALVAIGFDGLAEHDKLYRGSLSLLCQLALLNPIQFIECGGVRVLLHNVLCCTSPMVLEAMIGSLLHLLNVPETRDAAGVNLQSLVAPFTDVHFKHSEHAPSDKDIDEREVGYQCAKTAIGTVLRSWSGIAHFCQSRNSGLQALIDALYIEQLEIRRTILDLICEIVGVKFPTWSDEVTVALSAVDPSFPQDAWKLQEGFVVQEALDVLPHLAVCTPNITANHMALIVFSFIRRGLLEAVVEVIVTGDTFISVRGTVLLGELLSLVDKYIPLDCYDPSQCIPTLIRHSTGASANVPPPHQQQSSNSTGRASFASSVTPQSRQQRAIEAISVLSSLQKIKAKPPTPHSVFLQSQLQYAGYNASKRHGKFEDRLGQVQLSRVLKRDMEANPGRLLKDTGVLYSKDSTTWQWETIFTLIKWAPSSLKRVDDSSWRSFLKRLVDFFKPSNNLFARMELEKGQSRLLAKVGCALVNFLADDVENFCGNILLEELLVDIATQLDELLRKTKNPYSCFFSPTKLETTLSQTYFLFVGKLSHSTKGYRVLEKGDILKRFYDIIGQVHHACYIKCIVSSLSYREEYSKRILSAALTCSFDESRLYATQFLRVLVRAKLPGFSKWGMELLVNRLEDKNKTIGLTALAILEEAIHDKMYLESLIALKPSFTHLGDRGLLLLVCFLSLPSGYKFLQEANFLKNELHNWKTSFNKRYVELVEVLVRDSVSTLRRGADGKYPERASRNQEQSKFADIYVPPHLYGQLAQHKDGVELLLDSGDITALIEVVNAKSSLTPEDTKELKAALWALAHFSTSVDAVQIMEDAHVFESMVELGRLCPVLSVRHTTFHCLCLICVTQPGAEALKKYGWHAMPRNHHESYTLWAPEYYHDIGSILLKQEEEFLFHDEMEEDEEKGSMADTCSNILIEEDAEFYIMEEESNYSIELESKAYDSLPTDQVLSEQGPSTSTPDTTTSTRMLSHAHHRSQSDSQTLGYQGGVVAGTGGRNLFGVVEEKLDIGSEKSQQRDRTVTSGGILIHPRANSSSSGYVRGRVSSFLKGTSPSLVSGSAPGGSSSSTGYTPTTVTGTGWRSGSNGSWKWRKSRSDSVSDSTTSGVSSCDSSMGGFGLGAGRLVGTQPIVEHVQTLSPIPSSASIATTVASNSCLGDQQSPPSRDSSRMTLTEPLGRFGSFGSPSHLMYRSVKMRKPLLRMPILSDSDIYPSLIGGRRSALREPKTGSLDRHFILSPGDLFGESKLMRVNSSMTSLSTPSFRIRPESETKGPCFMGLCIPDDFQNIFLTDSSIPLHVRMTTAQDDSKDRDSNPLGFGDSFEFHSVEACLGCYKLKSEEPPPQPVPAAEGDDLVNNMELLDVPITDGTDQVTKHSGVSIDSLMYSGSMDLSEVRRIVPDSPEGKTVIRKEVLRFVSNLISCVGAKANEQGLLRLKQKFPQAFQDLCLYTELCALMSRYNLRLPFRRFLQEVFFDLQFEEFYHIVSKILYEEHREEDKGDGVPTCQPQIEQGLPGPGVREKEMVGMGRQQITATVEKNKSPELNFNSVRRHKLPPMHKPQGKDQALEKEMQDNNGGVMGGPGRGRRVVGFMPPLQKEKVPEESSEEEEDDDPFSDIIDLK